MYAPYLAVLSGDKAKMFKVHDLLGGTNWYGSRGKLLHTPADFKNAKAWYSYSYDHDSIIHTWHLSGYVFNGMKNTGTYSKSGNGEEPPASAYK